MYKFLYRGSFLILLLLFSGMSTFSQDLSLYEKEHFTSSDGFTLPYRILLPEGYEQGKKYPLILVLHGAGERGSDNEKQLIHGGKLFVDSLIRRQHKAIVLFPQCPENSYWSSVAIDRTKTPLALDFDYSRPISPPLKASIELVHELLKKERIDDRRVYITGLSMGGMGTFEAVHRYPDLFAAALPICGGGDTKHYKEVKTPFWVFHGSDDAVVNVQYSKEMVEKLKDIDVKVKYTEYAGVNHNSWDNAFAEPDFLPWMFKRKK